MPGRTCVRPRGGGDPESRQRDPERETAPFGGEIASLLAFLLIAYRPWSQAAVPTDSRLAVQCTGSGGACAAENLQGLVFPPFTGCPAASTPFIRPCATRTPVVDPRTALVDATTRTVDPSTAPVDATTTTVDPPHALVDGQNPAVGPPSLPVRPAHARASRSDRPVDGPGAAHRTTRQRANPTTSSNSFFLRIPANRDAITAAMCAQKRPPAPRCGRASNPVTNAVAPHRTGKSNTGTDAGQTHKQARPVPSA